MDADSLVTERDDIVLGILTADCAPIIILGKKKVWNSACRVERVAGWNYRKYSRIYDFQWREN